MVQLLRILTALVVVALAIQAVAVAVALAIMVGLIFRTKQTFAILAFCVALAAFAAHPGVGLLVIGLLAAISWLQKGKRPQEDAKALPPSGG